MGQKGKLDSLLSGYRGLDLTDEKGFLCGRILGDLGADVIKVERPGGDPTRNIGPFYKDIPHPEKSLYWFAYNANKRGITLNIETATGQDIFRRLVQTADFVLESSPPGYMEGLGVGYPQLERVNPRIILTSITPFGQTGPYRDYKASDIVGMAMGGLMYMTGDPDRPPLFVSFPQSYPIASSEAAVGTMFALYYRGWSGEGQWVDVSMQQAAASYTANAIPFWELNEVVLEREGEYRAGLSRGAKQRQLWRCKDGFVICYMLGGAFGAVSNRALTEWMESKGFGDDFMSSTNWETFDMATQTQETEDRLEASVSRFFIEQSKEELYREAIKRGVNLCPVSTPKDLCKNAQLEARDYWAKVPHPELGVDITYPGAFIKASETACRISRRAPLIGEHNQEVYRELGLSDAEIVTLNQAGVI